MSVARPVIALIGVAITSAVAGCAEAEPRPQWTVIITTDAPVPQLGDRLLVEVLDAEGKPACSGCRRQFGAAPGDLWPISFGVAPPADGQDVHIRARLYRARDTGPDGLPGSAMLIDAVGKLPETSEVLSIELPLRMDCFGVPSDLAAFSTCDPKAGDLAPEPTLEVVGDEGALPKAGSWAPAQPADCLGDVGDEMVCIPGGVFLLGSIDGFPPFWVSAVPRPERLVKVSPFAMDKDELSVGEMRRLVKEEGLPEPAQHSPAVASWFNYNCTYLSSDDPANDELPVNCISFNVAKLACEARGMRLPTEAEWELAAGNLTSETKYPWGSDEDICQKAIAARGDYPLFTSVQCRIDGDNVLPSGVAPGGLPEDVTELGVKNLGGNVSEWCADAFRPYDDPCWIDGPRLLTDPRCDADTDGKWGHIIRGGSWGTGVLDTSAFHRSVSVDVDENGQQLSKDGMSPFTGVRCVKSM